MVLLHLFAGSRGDPDVENRQVDTEAEGRVGCTGRVA